MGSSSVSSFELIGRVGRDVVSATWRDGQLVADAALVRRADLLVGMGETFAAERGKLRVVAGLDEPLAAALTLIRSFDAVVRAKIELGSDVPLDGRQ